jgi:pilus assembly protein CpaF
MPELRPLKALMKDPTITEIMVNDLRNMMVEKDGKLMFSGFAYTSIDELNRLARNILDVTGRIMTPDQPYVDVMLADGSRVNLVGPPLTPRGPCITIRKFPAKPLTIEDLIASDMMDKRMAHFLSVCVLGRMNILISGGTGSGKTTLLNSLLGFIPKGERLVTIEDTLELVISHINSVRLQTKLGTPMAQGISARELLAHALRMRPDRVVMGECRRGEAFDMLQAMNTGHTGSMTTLHANSPRDGLARLETLCMMSGLEIPIIAIRKQICSAIDVIIQIQRLRNGRRKVTAISEVIAMESEVITMQDIFVCDLDARSENSNEATVFRATGFVPTFLDRLKAQGVELPKNYFG